MSIIVKQELNPIYETILLLYQGYDPERYKEEMINDLNDSGINGEEFYQKFYKTVDKYVRTFQKYSILDEQDIFILKDTSSDFYLSLATLFFVEKDFHNRVSRMSSEELLQIILDHSEDIFDKKLEDFKGMKPEDFTKAENLTNFINLFDLIESEKWKLLIILQDPLKYYRNFAELIKRNIPAYEKAVESVKPLLDKKMELFQKAFTTDEKIVQFFDSINLKNFDIKYLTPAFISASGIVIFSDTCYYGLLAKSTMDELGLAASGKEHLMTCLKIFSDRSKLEILTLLKDSPKYATELAEQLNLTQATVSHHMNMLLAAKLVYIRKEKGKYYYHIKQNIINDVLEQLKQLLL